MLKDTLFELTSVYSPSGKERPAVEYVVHFCKKLGIEVVLDELHNCYIYLPGKGDSVLLTGHLDTVTNGYEPRPTLKDGYVTSENNAILGLDDKASVAVFLETLKYFVESDVAHPPLEIVLPVNEETGCIGSQHIVNETSFDLKSKVGICFDLPRPLGTILHGSAGLWRGTVKVSGVTAHSARPHLAKDAVVAGSAFVSEFLKRRGEDGVRINIGYIDAGYQGTYNMIPDNYSFEVDLRSLNDLDGEFSKMKQLMDDFSKKYEVAFEIVDEYCQIPNYTHAEDDAWVEKIQGVMRQQGIEIENDPFSYGCSDANFFQKAGVNVVVLGNAVENTHNTDERVKLEELENVLEFLKRFLTI